MSAHPEPTLPPDADPSDVRQATLPPDAGLFRGLAAAGQNAIPGLCLLAFAACILAAYYGVPEVTRLLDALGRLKARGGFAYGIVSTALFGAVFPALIQRLARRSPPPRRSPRLHFAVLLGFWAFTGLQVDVLYRLQSQMFGDGTDLSTLVRKVAVDMGVFVPLVAAPLTVAVYQWNDRHFGPAVTRASAPFRARSFPAWIRRDVIPMIISDIAVWMPCVFVIYALPPALQLVVFNFILCFWSLIVAIQTRM